MHSWTPAELVERFGHCARALDEDGARELSIGWNTPGDAPRRLYKKAAQKRWELRVLGPAQVSDDRAVQQLTLYWPERRKTVGSIWAHLLKLPEGWMMAGAQADRRVAGLFLGGSTPPVLTVSVLPSSPEAEAWGERRMAELREDVLRARADVEAAWPVPVLGRIPAFPSSAEVAPSLRGVDANHPALEAHARVRDALAPYKRLVLTSSVSGEGKSTLTANLAYALGLMGRRVAIVDGDLRMPRVWRRWKLDPGPGLCECVDGVDPVKALQTGDAAGVVLLTAGRAPADPTDVLANAGPVVDAVAAQVDSVLLDGAPGVEYQDAFVLAEATAAEMLVVVELGKTRRSDLMALRANFEKRGVQPVGVVLNRLPVDELGELRALGDDEGVTVRMVGSAWLEPVGRALVGLDFARNGEPGRTEWVILQHGKEGFEQIGRSKVKSIGALLKDAVIAGPKAYGSEWRGQQVAQAFAAVVDERLGHLGTRASADSNDPTAGMLQMIQALVAEAASGKTLSRPSVPVTVDIAGQQMAEDGTAAQPISDGMRDSVLAAVQKVFGERALEGGNLTEEEIKTHGPELAGEVVGALLGSMLPEAIEVDEGRKVSLNLDLASVFSSMLNKDKGAS